MLLAHSLLEFLSFTLCDILYLRQLIQFLLITFGLAFYWFGLAIIRIMLARSVSLNMLASFQKGLGGATAKKM